MVKLEGDEMLHIQCSVFDPITGVIHLHLSDCKRNGIRVRVPFNELTVFSISMN